MSYLALARKWRPQSFSDVIGQDHVVTALTNSLDSERIHHAFLFTGTRGVGKTTLARIFAKALNCESGISAEPCGECNACTAMEQGNHLDLIEVDAASRTKVESTRELLDNVQYTPTLGRFKVYLIDEVHMLSSHSFNALLKTLEEPPEHVKFLLATTNPQKLPATILSRCIQFNLKAVDIGPIHDRLSMILDAEKLAYEPEAITILARSASGSVRDALSLLDQAIAYGNGNVDTGSVRAMLGMIDDQFISGLLHGVLSGNGAEVLETVSDMSERTVDFQSALDDVISLLHNISLYQVSPDAVGWKGVDAAQLDVYAKETDPEFLQLLYQIAIIGKRDFQFAADPRSGFEMTLMRMLAFNPGGKGSSVSTGGQFPARKPTPEKQQPSRAEAPDATSSEKAGKDPEATTLHIIQGNEGAVAEPEAPAGEDNGSKGASEAGFDLQKILQSGGWQHMIDLSGINGISREILMNMVPQSVSGNVVSAILDASSRHLLNKNRIDRISGHLREALSLDIKLNVSIEELDKTSTVGETPTRHNQRKQQEKEDSALQAFNQDSNVQDLVDMFDAEIVKDSIKPGKS